jgi:hypothetical protein
MQPLKFISSTFGKIYDKAVLIPAIEEATIPLAQMSRPDVFMETATSILNIGIDRLGPLSKTILNFFENPKSLKPDELASHINTLTDFSKFLDSPVEEKAEVLTNLLKSVVGETIQTTKSGVVQTPLEVGAYVKDNLIPYLDDVNARLKTVVVNHGSLENLNLEALTNFPFQLMGVSPNKVLQLASSLDFVPEKIRRLIGKSKSLSTPYISMAEANKQASKALGHEITGLNLTGHIGTGSIGSVFLAQADETPEMVVKLLHQHSTPEVIAREEQAMMPLVHLALKHGKNKDYFIGLVESFYKGLYKELDLNAEASNTRIIGSTAKHFSVPDIIASAPTALAMTKAPGLNGMKWLEIHKLISTGNKEEALALLGKNNPNAQWIVDNHQQWGEELSQKMISAFYDQYISSKALVKDKDWHLGNFLVDVKPEGMVLSAVDHGDAVTVSQKEANTYSKEFIDFLLANSNQYAEALWNRANGGRLPVTGAEKRSFKRFCTDFKSFVFSKGHSRNDAEGIALNRTELVRGHGLTLPEELNTLETARIKGLLTLKEIMEVTGTQPSAKTVTGLVGQLLKEGVTTNPLWFIPNYLRSALGGASHPIESAKSIEQIMGRATKTTVD